MTINQVQQNSFTSQVQGLKQKFQEGCLTVQSGAVETKRRVVVFAKTYGDYLYLGAKVLTLITNPISFAVGFAAGVVMNSEDKHDKSISQRIAPSPEKKSYLAVASLGFWYFFPLLNGLTMGAATADDLIHLYRQKRTAGTPLVSEQNEQRAGNLASLAAHYSGSTTLPEKK